MDRGVTEIRDFIDTAQFSRTFAPYAWIGPRGRRFQIVHDFIDELLERQQLVERFSKAWQCSQPASVDRTARECDRALPAQVGRFDLLVSGEAIFRI